MQVDAYTKFILTVIAICLLADVLRGTSVISEAQAATDRGENVVKVQIVSIDESPSLRWEALPVEVQ
jgi:hypothetical protein